MSKVKIDFVTALSSCSHCKKAQEEIEEIISKYKGKIELNHKDIVQDSEEDIDSIRKKYGIIMTPFIAINGKVFANGKTPTTKELKSAIEESL